MSVIEWIMKCLLSLVLLLLPIQLSARAPLVVRPTTTLTALTANNTSASSSYTQDLSGNATPGNVSKLPLQSLLYPGATTKIYAHFMGWFGSPDHISVGYRSDDPAQLRRQVEDMISRGISGVIASWDTNPMVQKSVPLLLREVERHPGFEFAIELEAFGFRRYSKTVSRDITPKLIEALERARTLFETSPSYMQINGRPVVFFFGLEQYVVDWERVRAQTRGNPIFIFRNPGAFEKSYSDGAFAWSEKSKTDPRDEMLGYLDKFYQAALTHPRKYAFGSVYAGFNDTLASWGQNKVMDRHCGQTWLDTFARVGRFFSAGKQLAALRLVTWNDYEEGTAIEPGVENCVSVTASLQGSTLRWSITGNANTLDHFTVYISLDGQNLMPLQDLGSGTRSLDLTRFNLAPGNYVLYVRAVAKPGILNKMSAPVKFTLDARDSSRPLSPSPQDEASSQ
jgi:hypothetical protein